MKPHERIIVALDVSTIVEAVNYVKQLRDHVGMFKVGLELVHSVGTPLIMQVLRDHIPGSQVMLDLKLDDIPNTMTGAMKAIERFSPRFVTIHASSGSESIRAAVEAKGDSQILGVTVLTSISPAEARRIFGQHPEASVAKLVKLLQEEGADGVVCSPQEATRVWFDRQLLQVIPGIRPTWAVAGDQQRITTPATAITRGADFLVVGRPITRPPAGVGGPAVAAHMIAEEIRQTLENYNIAH